jgi:5-methyltetrahydrofolate--homocysteine methyltransferase
LYAGDAFPCFDTHIGPGSLAIYLGSSGTFDSATVWYGKCVDSLADSPIPGYDPDNALWIASQNLCRRGMERLKGKALVSLPDIIENIDILASLRGTEEILFDLMECPEEVHRWQKAVNDLYFEYYDRLFEIIKDEDGGSCFSMFNVWGPGKVSKVQCDMSAMLSAPMFDEFIAPYLAEQCKRLDYTVYHLDGPQAIQHVDTLLAIEDLNAIQWTPGAANIDIGDPTWMPLYKKIREGGKGLMLMFLKPDDAERIVGELGPEGLDLCFWVDSEEEAEELLKRSANWRKNK